MNLRISRAENQGVSKELVENIFQHIHSDSVNIQTEFLKNIDGDESDLNKNSKD